MISNILQEMGEICVYITQTGLIDVRGDEDNGTPTSTVVEREVILLICSRISTNINPVEQSIYHHDGNWSHR